MRFQSALPATLASIAFVLTCVLLVTRVHDVIFVGGTVGLVGPTGFQLRERDGQAMTVSLAEDWSVVIVTPMERTELKRGNNVATSAVKADGSGLVSHSYQRPIALTQM
jgi:hypothetical protein